MAVSRDLLNSIRDKFSTYTMEQCLYAKTDIANTLQYYGNQQDHDYVDKLWAEIDAANERIAYLQRNGAKGRLATAQIDKLLEALQKDCEFIGRYDFCLPLHAEGRKILAETIREWWKTLP